MDFAGGGETLAARWLCACFPGEALLARLSLPPAAISIAAKSVGPRMIVLFLLLALFLLERDELEAREGLGLTSRGGDGLCAGVPKAFFGGFYRFVLRCEPRTGS